MSIPIDLREIETHVVGRSNDKLRASHMRELAQKLELKAKFPEGVTASPGFVGCGISHIRLCQNAPTDKPFLLLEDDVDITKTYAPKLDIPSDADIVFLGVTSYGLAPDMDNRALEHAAITEAYDEDYVRVHNMLGAHALLFVTQAAKQAYIEASQEYITIRFRPHDIALVDLAKKFKFYAPLNPSFFQSTAMQPKDKKWPAERASMRVTPPRKEGDEVTLRAGKYGRRHMRIIRESGGYLDWELLKILDQ